MAGFENESPLLPGGLYEIVVPVLPEAAAALLRNCGLTGRTNPPPPPSDECDGEHEAAGAKRDSHPERIAHDPFHGFPPV